MNGILPFRRLVDELPEFKRHAEGLQSDESDGDADKTGSNEFSGPAYRVINFVADIPVRVDAFVESLGGNARELGNVIFVLTEFQVMDVETARQNELGENSHAAYKERQHVRVKARLTGGSRALRERSAPNAVASEPPSGPVMDAPPPEPSSPHAAPAGYEEDDE